jgi:hypothetical protein
MYFISHLPSLNSAGYPADILILTLDMGVNSISLISFTKIKNKYFLFLKLKTQKKNDFWNELSIFLYKNFTSKYY